VDCAVTLRRLFIEVSTRHVHIPKRDRVPRTALEPGSRHLLITGPRHLHAILDRYAAP
jgi:hypothetical protein